MIIAFVTSITLLPALLAVLNPPSEPHPMGFAQLAPVDRFLELHRIPVVVIIILVVVLASPLLFWLQFDFNPLHLQSPKVEIVATFLELRNNRQTGANAIEIEAPDLAAANATAQRLSALPQVSQTRTLSDLVPGDQDEKLKFIHDAETAIDASLNPREVDRPPTDQQDIEALSTVADALSKVAGNNQGPGADAARRLSELLTQLAEADPLARMRAETAVTAPLRISLDQLRQELKPERITTENIPSDVAGEWVTTDRHARVQVLPKGDPEDTEVLRCFATSVLAVEPNATGPAVFLYEARNTVVRAFIEAGILRPLGDRHSVVDRIASDGRCGAHPPAASRRRRRYTGTMRRVRSSAEFCQHHRAAAVARRRRCIQDLLYHGVEGRENRPAAIQPDPGGDLQRYDYGNGVRQPVAVQSTRHLQHGKVDGAGAGLHYDGGRVVSTRSDGPPAGERIIPLAHVWRSRVRRELRRRFPAAAGSRQRDPGPDRFLRALTSEASIWRQTHR